MKTYKRLFDSNEHAPTLLNPESWLPTQKMLIYPHFIILVEASCDLHYLSILIAPKSILSSSQNTIKTTHKCVIVVQMNSPYCQISYSI